MLFSHLVTANRTEFYTKLQAIAATLQTDVDFIECVMYLESRLNPKAYNPNGGATGLIQFMPSTAAALGTSTAALYNMSNVQQLDYVLKYYYPYRGKLNSFADVYGVTFFPIMIGKPDEWILQTSSLSASKIAQANKIFDLNSNNAITAGEFRTAIYKLLPVDIALYLRTKGNTVATAGAGLLTLGVLITAIVLIKRQANNH